MVIVTVDGIQEMDFGRAEEAIGGGQVDVVADGLVLDSKKSEGDFPRAYDIYSSKNGKNWEKIASAKGAESVIEIYFNPIKTRYLKVQLTEKHDANWWSIHELDILQKSK